MKLVRGLHAIDALKKGSVVSVGNFDGVHRGHRALLQTLREQAARLQLPLVVVLFEPQPSEFFLKESAPSRLSRLRDKLVLLKEQGVDYVYCLRFTQKLAECSAKEFADDFLFGCLNAQYIMVGRDFRFGRDRTGDIVMLSTLAQTRMVVVDVCPDFLVDNHRVSSTRIRDALKNGALSSMPALLGQLYSLSGRVMHGRAMGRTWQVPTANILVKQSPLQGIFCVYVKRSSGTIHRGVASLGYRPTVQVVHGHTPRLLEVYLFDFNEELYGERLTVFFAHPLREELKFDSIETMVVQIHADIAAAKLYFEEKQECQITKIL